MTRAGLAAIGLSLAAASALASEPPLRMVAPLNHAMPFGEFKSGVFVGGVVKDLSDTLAERIGRRIEYLPTPARRVAQAITQGEADGVCYVARGWVRGDLHWSPRLFDHVGVVAARAEAPPPPNVAALAGQRLGTVASYHYPEIDLALGAQFLRDDAPNMDSALRKLAAGRTAYALTEQMTLAYEMRLRPQSGLRPVLETTRVPTHCVFSTQHGLPLAQLDKALNSMLLDGTVTRILARYR